VDRQEPAAKVLWRIEEPPVARDPAQLAATLRQLARLNPVELGQQAVLERIVQAAATCCASTGGVGLLLLNRDQQLRYVAAAGRPRRSLAGSQVRLGQGPSVDAFLEDAPVASTDLAGESRWPDFRPLALAAGIRAWLSVPVRQRHGPIGVLDLACTDPQPRSPRTSRPPMGSRG
jgi:GAF domain-containing protein